jgi:hypothetical protein
MCICQTTRGHNREYCNLHIHCRAELRSHTQNASSIVVSKYKIFLSVRLLLLLLLLLLLPEKLNLKIEHV